MIVGTIAMIYKGSHQHAKTAYGARDWCYNPDCLRRHDMQLLQQKYCQSLVVYAPPCLPMTPRNRGRAPYSHPPQDRRRYTTGTLQISIFCPRFILPMHSRMIPVTVVQDTYVRREQPPNMVNYRVHMDPFSMSPCRTTCRTVPSTPFPFIAYHGTIPMPTS